VADAASHRHAGYAREGGPIPWPFQGASDHPIDFTPPGRFSFSCNSLEVAALAAAQGAGMARLPVWLVAGERAEGRLQQVFERQRPSAIRCMRSGPMCARCLSRRVP
jgi:DNA-binding transcriptional LysR family regulator